MQDLLVINDNQVIVQCGEYSYTDTFENFIADGGGVIFACWCYNNRLQQSNKILLD